MPVSSTLKIDAPPQKVLAHSPHSHASVKHYSTKAENHRDIEVTCYCGHKAALPYHPVIAKFSRKNWPISLGSATEDFRCSKCGSSPAYIGPMER